MKKALRRLAVGPSGAGSLFTSTFAWGGEGRHPPRRRKATSLLAIALLCAGVVGLLAFSVVAAQQALAITGDATLNVSEDAAADSVIHTYRTDGTFGEATVTVGDTTTTSTALVFTAATGALAVGSAGLDYEAAELADAKYYTVTLTATQGTAPNQMTAELVVTVNIEDVAGPAITGGTEFSLTEGTAADTEIEDYDTADGATFGAATITVGDTDTVSTALVFTEATGVLAVGSNPLDYEAAELADAKYYTVTLTATEDGESTMRKVKVTVTDVAGPTITGPTEVNVSEDAATESEIETYTTGGVFGDATITVGDTDTASTALVFTAATGVLAVGSSALDYEGTELADAKYYTVTLTATQDGEPTTHTVKVNVVNVGPTITGDDEVSVPETAEANTVIARYSTGGSATWSVAPDATFSIATSGAVSIDAALTLADSPYTMTVTATEGAETSELRVTVTVEDIGPTVSGDDVIVLGEGEARAANAMIAQYTSGEAVTWSLGGTAAGQFTIATNGALSVGGTALAEGPLSLSLTVIATKVGGSSTELADVTNYAVMVVHEAPDATTDDTTTPAPAPATSGDSGDDAPSAPAPAAAPAMQLFSATAPAVTVTERQDAPGQSSLVFTRHDGGASFSVPIGWISSDGSTVIALGFVRDESLGQTYAIVRRESDGQIVRLWVAPDSALVYAVNWPDVLANYTVPLGILAVVPLDGMYPAANQLARRFDGGDDRIFSYDAGMGQWRHVPDLGTFQSLGFYWCDVTAADAGFFGSISIGPAHPSSGMAPSADYPSCRT